MSRFVCECVCVCTNACARFLIVSCDCSHREYCGRQNRRNKYVLFIWMISHPIINVTRAKFIIGNCLHSFWFLLDIRALCSCFYFLSRFQKHLNNSPVFVCELPMMKFRTGITRYIVVIIRRHHRLEIEWFSVFQTSIPVQYLISFFSQIIRNTKILQQFFSSKKSSNVYMGREKNFFRSNTNNDINNYGWIISS